eukprot:2592031-Karenia_brevis.AAC.1
MQLQWACAPSPHRDDGQRENIDSRRLASANLFQGNLCKMQRDLVLFYDEADSGSRPGVSALSLLEQWVCFGPL